MHTFNKLFFITILSLFIGFTCLPFFSIVNTANAGGGGDGGGGTDQADQSAPSGTMVTISEACEAINSIPQVSRNQFIDKSLQSAMNFMDKNATAKPEPKEKEKGPVLPGQQLGAMVLGLLIECPELTPKQAIIIAISLAACDK